MNKPYSESCEQNKAVILEAISSYLKPEVEVLEVGSGTGQHAVYFAEQHPLIKWQTSDRPEYLPGIEAWISDANLPNVENPIVLDVQNQWPDKKYDLIFTANTFHIMNQNDVEKCLAAGVKCLQSGGYLIVYGPFNYNGNYTSASNAQFDRWLNSQNPQSGIKHFEWIEQHCQQCGLTLINDIEMPANNRILIWQRETFNHKN